MINYLTKLKEYVRRMNHSLTYLFRQGSWAFKDHERLVLDAALGALDQDARELAGRQLEQSFFLERNSGGRINVIRFYSPAPELRIRNDDFTDLLVKVKIIVDGRQQTAHVTFYKGLVFSIEFKKPGQFYTGKNLQTVSVTIGKPGQSYTQGIDRLEHGKIE